MVLIISSPWEMLLLICVGSNTSEDVCEKSFSTKRTLIVTLNCDSNWELTLYWDFRWRNRLKNVVIPPGSQNYQVDKVSFTSTVFSQHFSCLISTWERHKEGRHICLFRLSRTNFILMYDMNTFLHHYVIFVF